MIFVFLFLIYFTLYTAAAAAKSLQSCPTLSDPMDCSLPGSSFHGIFQARVLEWVAIAFSKPLLYLAATAKSCVTTFIHEICLLWGLSFHHPLILFVGWRHSLMLTVWPLTASEFAIPIWFNCHNIPHEETEKSCELIPFQTFFKKIDV